MSRRRLAAAPLVLLLVGACEHSEPFTGGEPVDNPPRGAGPVYQVTFNVADDRHPSWLPDGSSFIYSREREDRSDHDRCIAVQPASGGTFTRLACRHVPGYDDTTDVWESPAVNQAGDVLYLRTSSRIGRQKRDHADIVLARFAEPIDADVVIALPYPAESGRMHSGAGEIRWVSNERFVYLGQRLIFQGSTFFPDTFLTGLDVVEVTLSGSSAVRRVVPGTAWASSVSPGDDGDSIYYTIGGDSRVFRQSLSSGAVTLVHDFGAEGIARGAQVRGDRLVAVVGGSVLFRDEGELEMVQRDEGGHLFLVDLTTGAETRLSLSQDTLFHRPALSPDGARVVVEASPFAPVHTGPDSEFNAPNHRHDIWLFELP